MSLLNDTCGGNKCAKSYFAGRRAQRGRATENKTAQRLSTLRGVTAPVYTRAAANYSFALRSLGIDPEVPLCTFGSCGRTAESVACPDCTPPNGVVPPWRSTSVPVVPGRPRLGFVLS